MTRPPPAARLAAIHAAALPPAEAWSEAAIATLLGSPGCFAVAEEEDGFLLARVAADEAEVLTLAVRPEARRRGVALRLLDRALAAAIAKGARVIWLEVAAGNAAARALYGRAGFREAGRRRDYYGPGRDALVLRLDLAG